MIYPMNDFGNTAKWAELIVGTAQIVEKTENTVKMRNNAAGDKATLVTVAPVDIVAEGVLEVEIWADRRAAVTGLKVSPTPEDVENLGVALHRDAVYGVICWRHGGADYIMSDTTAVEEPVSLRIKIDAATRRVTYYYDGVEIWFGTISGSINLRQQYISFYATATRSTTTILDTSTFLSYYVSPPEHTLTISTTLGGTTNPSPGAHSYIEGSIIAVTAILDAGYEFSHWELDGVNVAVNPISITMDKDHTLHAVFNLIPVPTTHTLTVDSSPQGIPFSIEKVG